MDSASDGKLVSTREASLAAALTCVGGYVDAIGYLSLGQVYVANMSGNSVSLGINSARLDWPQIWKHGWPILSYVVGLVMSRFIVTWTKRNEAEFGASLAFGLQAVLLMCFIALHSGAGGVFLCACAMGIQAATLSRFGGFNVYTAFVTGTLVKMGDALVDAFWAFWDALWRVETASDTAESRRKNRRAAWFAANWGSYLMGAIAGALFLQQFGIPAMTGAIVVLFVVIGISFRRPDVVKPPIRREFSTSSAIFRSVRALFIREVSKRSGVGSWDRLASRTRSPACLLAGRGNSFRAERRDR